MSEVTLEKLLAEAQASQKNNATTDPQRFQIIWANDALSDICEPLPFLVDGLFTKGSVNLLVGAPGSKKTWIAMHLAGCVATGTSWLNFPVENAAVLFVDEESGPRRLRRRLYETLNWHLIKKTTNIPIAYTSLSMLNLRDLGDVNNLQMMIEHTNAGLVIIDALADIMLGADENSVKDVQPIMMQLRRVATVTQAAIIVIHHSNKQNGTSRGSTAINGSVDLILKVESKPESKYITFSTEKARDIEPQVFSAEAHWNMDSEEFYLTASDIENRKHLSKSQLFVLDYLYKNGNSELDSMTNSATGCAPSTAHDAARKFIKSGHIIQTAGERGRGHKTWIELSSEGRKLAESR